MIELAANKASLNAAAAVTAAPADNELRAITGGVSTAEAAEVVRYGSKHGAGARAAAAAAEVEPETTTVVVFN